MTTRQNDAHRRETLVITDMRQVENPFRNLHPKLYHRQKNLSSKLNMANIPELGRRLKTRQQTAVSLSPMILNVGGKALQKDTSKNDYDFRNEESFNVDWILNRDEKITYLNQKSASMMKTHSTQKEMKLLFPLITPPSNLSSEEHFTTSREFRHNILPGIRCGSFISMVSVQDVKEKPKRQKISRYNQRTQNPTNPPSAERDNQNESLPAELSKSDSQTKKSTCAFDIRKAKYHNKGDVAAVSRNNNGYRGANAERNSSEEKSGNVMVLRAKLHRSSFV